MAELKFFNPFPHNDNFDVTSASSAGSENSNSLFIANRLKRGEHVTFENSGLSQEEWQDVMKRFGTQ